LEVADGQICEGLGGDGTGFSSLQPKRRRAAESAPYLGPGVSVFHAIFLLAANFWRLRADVSRICRYIYKVIEMGENLAGREDFSNANGVH
jgi:hypothetical protein